MLFLLSYLFVSSATIQLRAEEIDSDVDNRVPELQVVESRDPEYIRVLFGGDTHFRWGIHDMIEEHGYEYPVSFVAPLFHRADFSIVNLETSLTDAGEPMPGFSHIFHDSPDRIAVLEYLQVDKVSLANNHTMDMGADGLMSMIKHLNKAGMLNSGAGRNSEEALRPVILENEEIRIAIISAGEIGHTAMFAGGNSAGIGNLRNRMAQRVRRARTQADHVVVSLHWGREYFTRPLPHQVRFARSMIDAGATAVIGHHPHVPQGFEVYRNGFIAYSLGNFLFGSVTSQQTHNIVVELLFDRQTGNFAGAEIQPIHGIYRYGGHRVRPLNFMEAIDLWEELYVKTEELGSGDHLKIHYDGYGRVLLSPEN